MSRHAAAQTTTSRRRVLLSPGRADLVDAGFVFVLMTLAVLGLRSTYSGSLYLIVGLAGTVLGLLIAHLANALRQPMISVAAMALAAFFLLGGAVALRGTAIAGVLPSGATFHGLADEGIHGWKDLLTTLPPVDGRGPLLVLPYVLGLIGGVGGLTMSRRLRASFAPLAAPFAVLVVVILLGTRSPAALTVQGAVFATIALAWASVRAGRQRPPLQNGSGQLARLTTAVTLLVVAGAGAAVVGPHVPGTGSHKRVVLRSYVHPPFDIRQYPSPLAGFRKYTATAQNLYGKQLFAVSGDAPTMIRIATLDSYDNLTWRASNEVTPGDSPVPDTFQRVGSKIANPARGTQVTFTVTIRAGYSDVWLPDAGDMTRISFAGADAKHRATNFRYNLATGTGVVPDRLKSGDTYTVHAVNTSTPLLKDTDTVASGGAGPADGAGDFLRSQANDWSQKTGNPTEAIYAVAKHMRDTGKFTDGEGANNVYLPGHYLGRLLDFVNGSQMAGDEEQYAATFALIVNELGTPARVVLGARVSASGVVTGKDVTAWVEVQLSGGSWRAVMADTFMNRDSHPDKQPQQQPQQPQGQIVPPPSHVRPHSALDDAEAANVHSLNTATPKTSHSSHGFVLPAWISTTAHWAGPPIGVLLALAGAVVGAKALRRRRRRTRGSPSVRLAHGWREIVDQARDLGTVLPAGQTRREEAALLTVHDVAALALAADAHVFGAAEPADADAHGFWRDVDIARRRMSRGVSRWRRLRAAVSLASLRRRPAARAGAPS